MIIDEEIVFSLHNFVLFFKITYLDIFDGTSVKLRVKLELRDNIDVQFRGDILSLD